MPLESIDSESEWFALDDQDNLIWEMYFFHEYN